MVSIRFHALALAAALTATASAAAPQAQGTFLAQNGLVAIQFESSPAVGDWTLKTSTSGFTGDGYFEWDGPNLFSSPGQGVFGFDFEVEDSGNWELRMYNRHEDPDPTEENDVWIRMDGGEWVKTFSNGPGSVGDWTWESRFDFDHGNQPDASYNLSTGAHRIEFSGRSNGFKMDQFHLFRNGAPGALDPTTPESPRRFGAPSCTAQSNSTGSPSTLIAEGSPRADDDNVILTTQDLPNDVLGYYIVSQTSVFVANAGGSSGNLCVGGNVGRYAGDILNSGSIGQAAFRLELTDIPRPMGSGMIQGGETWYFQFWHRDAGSGGATSNFSPAIELEFE